MTKISKCLSAILMSVLLIGFILGGFVDSEAARKAKFRYDKPDAWNWVNYCDKKHRKMYLGTCCSRRTGACEKRCKKSRFPNNVYQSRGQCLSDCRETKNVCNTIADDRDNFRRSKEEFRQCRSKRKVVDRNVCCRKQAVQCGSICGWHYENRTKNERKFEKCFEECREHQHNSCIKKFSNRQYAKMKKRTHNPQWMNTYCSNPDNLKDRSKGKCCKTMRDRCDADCDGRPDSPKAISACKHRCIKASNICKSTKR